MLIFSLYAGHLEKKLAGAGRGNKKTEKRKKAPFGGAAWEGLHIKQGVGKGAGRAPEAAGADPPAWKRIKQG